MLAPASGRISVHHSITGLCCPACPAEECMRRGSIETARAIYAHALSVFPGKKSIWRRAAQVRFSWVQAWRLRCRVFNRRGVASVAQGMVHQPVAGPFGQQRLRPSWAPCLLCSWRRRTAAPSLWTPCCARRYSTAPRPRCCGSWPPRRSGCRVSAAGLCRVGLGLGFTGTTALIGESRGGLLSASPCRRCGSARSIVGRPLYAISPPT